RARIGTWKFGADDNRRKIDVWKLADRQHDVAKNTGENERGHNQRGHNRALYENFGNVQPSISKWHRIGVNVTGPNAPSIRPSARVSQMRFISCLCPQRAMIVQKRVTSGPFRRRAGTSDLGGTDIHGAMATRPENRR